MLVDEHSIGVRSLAIYAHPTEGWRTLNILGNVALTDKFPLGLKFSEMVEHEEYYEVRFSGNLRGEALRWSDRKVAAEGDLKLCRVPVESSKIAKLPAVAGATQVLGFRIVDNILCVRIPKVLNEKRTVIRTGGKKVGAKEANLKPSTKDDLRVAMNLINRAVDLYSNINLKLNGRKLEIEFTTIHKL